MQTLKMRMLTRFAFCIFHFALLITLAGCASKARAQTLPDGPPLAVPLPPPHEVAIEQIAEAQPQEPPPAPQPVQQTPAPATTVAKPRTETRETPPAVVQAPAPPTPQPEAPAVRATASAADEKKVQALLNRAASDLNTRVDYRKLSGEGKAQYEQSKRFSDQAVQAMKERRFDYALTLAEKAANIAAELVR